MCNFTFCAGNAAVKRSSKSKFLLQYLPALGDVKKETFLEGGKDA